MVGSVGHCFLTLHVAVYESLESVESASEGDLTYRILIVDDDHDMANVLGDRLQAAGYDTVSASNGRAALNLLADSNQAAPFRGILLDVEMPEMNGLDTLRELQQRDPHIPVLMMSAVAQPLIIEEALRLGAAAFISKSEASATFLERCRQIFGRMR